MDKVQKHYSFNTLIHLTKLSLHDESRFHKPTDRRDFCICNGFINVFTRENLAHLENQIYVYICTFVCKYTTNFLPTYELDFPYSFVIQLLISQEAVIIQNTECIGLLGT